MAEDRPKSKKSLRARMHHALEGGHPAGTRGALIEIFLVGLILFNVIAAALETVPSLDAVYGLYFTLFEVFSVAVFSIEYGLRLWAVPEDPRFRSAGAISGRLRYASQPLMLIDLLAIAPASSPLPIFVSLGFSGS
jgi:voltage-gated potassium channel